MAIQTPFRPTNPRLGTSFATFISAMIGFVIILAIFEQLGINYQWLGHFMIAVPVGFFIIIGVMTRTVLVEDFYTSGRRVPPFYNGLALMAGGFGGVMYFAGLGALFVLGYDMLAILIGWAMGFVLMAVMIAPYIRKFGSYSLPGYLGERFESHLVRLVAVACLVVPLFMLLIAEIRIGAIIGAYFFKGMPYGLLAIIGAVAVGATVLPGGMRSLSWSQSAQAIVLVLGFLVPLFLLTVKFSNLPLPELVYGSMIKPLTALETASGVEPTVPVGLEQALPSPVPMVLAKPFAQGFGLISRVDFVLLLVTVMTGIAVLPSLLQRAGTSVSVSGVRTAIGWTSLLLAVLLISMPAYAVFAKYILLDEAVGKAFNRLPHWFSALTQPRLIEVLDDNKDGIVSLQEILVKRDNVILTVPVMAGFPYVIVGLVAVAGIAAAMAAAGGHLVAMVNSLSNDIFYKTLFISRASAAKRLLAARLILLGIVGLAAVFAAGLRFDVLRVSLLALSIISSTFFPVVILSIWWKRMTGFGALVAMLTGFGLSMFYIISVELLGAVLFLGIETFVVAVIAMPVSLIAGIVVSYLLPDSDEERIRQLDDMVDEMRVASGEAVHDRALRLSARKGRR